MLQPIKGKKLIRLLEILVVLLICACDSTVRVSFVTDSQSASELQGTAEIILKLSRSSQIGTHDFNSPDSISAREIKVPFTVTGSASYGVNHQLASGVVIFPAKAKEAKIKVPLLYNPAYEGDKTLIVTLGEPQGAVVSGFQTHTLTILDVDKSPDATFEKTADVVSEGAGSVPITIKLEYASNKTVVIPFTVSGTATSGVDFTLSSSSLTIPAGQTSGTVQINVVDDFIIESNETVILTMDPPTGANLGAITTYTLTIADNDNLPTVNFSSASQTVSEAVGSVTVGVALSKTYPIDVDVPFTVSGTASNPADHDLAPSTLTVPAGATTANITFNVVNDSLDEDNETVILTMGTPTNANLGTTKIHTVTITDDDPSPTVAFTAASQSVSEGAGTATTKVTLSAVSGRTVTIPYTISGTANNPADHNLANGSFTIAAGTTSASKTISIVDDSLYEGNETIIITLGSPTNATLGAMPIQTITITENDPIPSVTFSSSSASALETAGSVTVAVSLNTASGLDTTIPFSTSGTATLNSDYSLSWTSGINSGSGTPVIITAGSTSATLTISIIDDTTYETNETAQLTLSSPTNATLGSPSAYTLTIINDDPVPTLNFSASAQSVSEATGTVYVLFVLSNPTIYNVSVPYTVSGTATKPSDHNLSDGTVTITAGTTEKVFTFQVVDDSIPEGSETVIMTMGTASNATVGYPSIHTVTILDNDRAFSLDNVKLWLDSTHELKAKSENQVLSWEPRKSILPFSDVTKYFSLSSLVPNFWLGLPAVEGFDSFALLNLLKIGADPDSRIDCFTVRRSSILGSPQSPKIIYAQGDSASNGLETQSQQFSELIWLENETHPKTLFEIEDYLKQKYHLDHVENEP